jgi:hypothetical protein
MFGRSVMAIAAVGLVAGCDGVVVQDAPAPRSGYYERDFTHATAKGAIVTVVAGNPFGMPQNEFDDLVRRHMDKQNREYPAEFVAGPSERTSPPYKVVVAFNKQRGTSPDNMCANPAGVRTAPDREELRIAIAFCSGDVSKSDTSGYVKGVAGTADPKFAALVRAATHTMLPPEGMTTYDEESDNAIP